MVTQDDRCNLTAKLKINYLIKKKKKKTGWYQTSQEHTQQDNCGKKHFQENSNAGQGFYIKQNDPSNIKANKKVIFKRARTQETVYPWTLLEESTSGWASCKQEIEVT